MRRTPGSTFIEMLVVMIVTGIRAALAIPKLQSSKDKGVVAGMTSNLPAIVEDQEAYDFQNRIYTTNLIALNANSTGGKTVVINEPWASSATSSLGRPRRWGWQLGMA